MNKQRRSEEKYRKLFETITTGFALCKAIRDETGKMIDYRFVDLNPAFENLTGLKNQDAVGRTILDIMPDLDQWWLDTYQHVVDSQETIRFEKFLSEIDRWYDVTAFYYGKDQFATYYDDITKRKRAEEQQTYLLKLSDALRSIADPVGIEETVTQIALQHFAADRCYYCRIEAGNAIINRDAVRGDLPSVAGTYPLSSFALLQKVIDEGRPFAVSDAATTPILDDELRAICLQLNVISFLNVPIIKNGKVAGVLCTVQSTPRIWTEAEIRLAIETAERIWAAVERARTEENLRASEEKFRTLFTSIDEGFCLVELIYDEHDEVVDYYFLNVNRIFEQQMGLTGAAGKRVMEIAPQTESYWLKAYETVARTGEPARFDTYTEHNQSWYTVFATRVGSTGSRQVAIIFDDITERKRTEGNLAFLAEVSRDLVHQTNIDETMSALSAKIGAHVNVARCAFFEFNQAVDERGSLDAVCQYDWRKGNVPSFIGIYRVADYHANDFLRTLCTGETFVTSDVETDVRLNARNFIPLGIRSFIVIPILPHKQLQFVLCLYDAVVRNWRDDEIELLHELTTRIWTRLQRARAEKALQESEEKFRLLGMASSDSIYKMSRDWTQMHQLIGKTFLADTNNSSSSWLEAYIPIEDQLQVQEVLREAIRTKSTFELEHRVLRADGTIGWTFSRAIPILDEQGAIQEWVGAASDITARKQAEEVLRESDRRKSEFLAMLAHELRNPLSTLHNTSLLLGITQGQDETLPLNKALGMMSREVTHLNRMIDDLLDVSRISQGKIQLHKERLDLRILIREALEAAHPQFASREQALTLHLPSEPIWVNGDRTRLTQVVRNLTSNAAKYTPNDGQIGITLEKEGDQAVLRIRDSGIGIATNQIQTIFEVFVQVSTSLDRPQGGLGLGLAVVKQLVELHGGHVGVQSPGLGQGSEFMVYLPGLPDAPPQSPLAGTGHGHAAKTGRILVVDDNADLALTTAMLLRHRKYEAHTCLSGPEALEAVELFQPIAILLDLGMPDMDGFETCRRLRALDWGRQGVIVALSGYGQEEDKKRTRESGFDGHLVKPLNLQTLTELLDNLLTTKESNN